MISNDKKLNEYSEDIFKDEEKTKIVLTITKNIKKSISVEFDIECIIRRICLEINFCPPKFVRECMIFFPDSKKEDEKFELQCLIIKNINEYLEVNTKKLKEIFESVNFAENIYMPKLKIPSTDLIKISIKMISNIKIIKDLIDKIILKLKAYDYYNNINKTFKIVQKQTVGEEEKTQIEFEINSLYNQKLQNNKQLIYNKKCKINHPREIFNIATPEITNLLQNIYIFQIYFPYKSIIYNYEKYIHEYLETSTNDSYQNEKIHNLIPLNMLFSIKHSLINSPQQQDTFYENTWKINQSIMKNSTKILLNNLKIIYMQYYSIINEINLQMSEEDQIRETITKEMYIAFNDTHTGFEVFDHFKIAIANVRIIIESLMLFYGINISEKEEEIEIFVKYIESDFVNVIYIDETIQNVIEIITDIIKKVLIPLIQPIIQDLKEKLYMNRYLENSIHIKPPKTTFLGLFE